jgi:pilus assembly protein CpaB
MMTKRVLMAVVIALLVSGIFTYFVSRRMVKSNNTHNSDKRFYVSAAKDLDAGETLSGSDVELVEWFGPGVLAGAFTKVSDVNGRTVLYPLDKGQPIIERQLATAGAGAGLTAKIPAGMRAISVRSDELVGVAGFLLPGTHVDVLMTYHTDLSPAPTTTTVLQDVVVLAAGQQIHPDPAGKPVSVNVVTLLLKPEDAEKIALAANLGGMYFVLRNGGDQVKVDTQAVGLSQLSGTVSPIATKAPGAAARTPSKPKTQHYDVETFLGDKQSTKSFN